MVPLAPDDPERILLGQRPHAPKPDKPSTLEPQDLDDLCHRAGPYADMIRTHVEWSAITAWQMRDTGEIAKASGIPSAVVSLSIFLVSKAEEHEAAWPGQSGQNTPLLYGYSADSQCEARRTAAEIHALWEASGRPYLNASLCKSVYRHMNGLMREGRLPPLSDPDDLKS